MSTGKEQVVISIVQWNEYQELLAKKNQKEREKSVIAIYHYDMGLSWNTLPNSVKYYDYGKKSFSELKEYLEKKYQENIDLLESKLGEEKNKSWWSKLWGF